MSGFSLTDQTFVALLRGDKQALAQDPVGYVVTPAPPLAGVAAMANAPQGRYRVEEDVIETTSDGRTIQIAVKGTEMTMAEAVRLGLVKTEQQQGPSEVKLAIDQANEQAAQAMQENTGDANAEAPSVAREQARQEADQAAQQRAADSAASTSKGSKK